MRRRELKRKNKWVFLKIIFFSLLLLVVLLGSYFLTTIALNSKIISPLASKYLSIDGENISQELSKAGISFSSVKRSSGSFYTITLLDGGEVIVTSKKNIKNQISSLQLILSRLTIEGKRVKVVDFRYDRPVIRL